MSKFLWIFPECRDPTIDIPSGHLHCPLHHFGVSNNFMNRKRKAISYTRDGSTRNQIAPYEIKFGGWIQAVAGGISSGAEVILISDPWVIGDNYEELLESLSRLAGSGLGLQIVRRKADVRDN